MSIGHALTSYTCISRLALSLHSPPGTRPAHAPVCIKHGSAIHLLVTLGLPPLVKGSETRRAPKAMQGQGVAFKLYIGGGGGAHTTQGREVRVRVLGGGISRLSKTVNDARAV